jgi:hypothetical protein
MIFHSVGGLALRSAPLGAFFGVALGLLMRGLPASNLAILSFPHLRFSPVFSCSAMALENCDRTRRK